jgi:hypothetical protein
MSATSEDYEVVVKNFALEVGKEARIDLYVSDFDTNAPVSAASVRLSLRASGREVWGGTAAPAEMGGTYAAIFTPSDTGAVNVIVTVQTDERQDEFALAGLEIGTLAHPAATPAALRRNTALWIGLGGLLAAGVLTLVWRARRRAVHGMSALVVGGLTALASIAAHGHEGHNQPQATAGEALEPGGEVYLAKESQFLLGVLTQPVVLENVQDHLQVQGRVAPRSGGELEIVAPQSGRIYFPNGRTPMLGERIRRGQLVATLLVVDSLNLRAALAGVVTDAHVVNGQLVDAGQKILRVLDTSVLWVHADIYERDLESVERARVARIISPAYPDQVFEGRRVALGASLGEVQGTVEAYFEVANSAGRLRVGSLVDIQIEHGGSQPTLIVPRSACEGCVARPRSPRLPRLPR